MVGDGLRLHGLRRSFGATAAVRDVSFAVPAGCLYGFVGRNGAGKTTTMRIVCGLLVADAGEVSWRGAGIDALARERIGYMPEERGLYPKMRLADQLEYFAVLHGAPHAEGRASAHAWLERLGLGDRADERVEALSHGNQQRVQLAAALVHDPELLILDEPFAGLDPIATDVMVGVLREQAARGVPVLLSSHQLGLVEEVCEAVAIIDDGRIVASGEVDALRAGGPRLVRVEPGGGDPSWTEALDGIRRTERTARGWVLELEPGADAQAVLDAARRAGPVRLFAESRPTLAELFREVVAG